MTLNPGMKFIAKGEGRREYTLIMVDEKYKQVALKRTKDGLVLFVDTERFENMIQKE